MCAFQHSHFQHENPTRRAQRAGAERAAGPRRLRRGEEGGAPRVRRAGLPERPGAAADGPGGGVPRAHRPGLPARPRREFRGGARHRHGMGTTQSR